MSKSFFILLLFIPTFAWAYIDPGTGSVVFQIVLGSIIGGMAFIKLYWNKIISFFSKPKKDSEEQQ